MDLKGAISSRTFLVHSQTMVTPSQNDPQFKLRLPAELKTWIDAQARLNNRSINAEIVARLEASFNPPQRASNEENLAGLVDHLGEAILELTKQRMYLQDQIDRLKDVEQKKRA